MMDKRKIKVLHVYRTYFPDPPGGLQEAIRQIALSTKPYGIDSSIFSLSPRPWPKEINREEARVFRERSIIELASCDFGGIKSLKTFKRLVEDHDIVHYQFPWPFADILHFLSRVKKPAILTYQSDIVRQRSLATFYEPLMWRTLLSIQAVVATSPAYALTSPVLSHPALRGRVRVIPLGIEESSYCSGSDTIILSRLGLNVDEPFVLFIGVHRYYKDLPTLVKAAALIRRKVVIAGSGPEEQRIRALAKDLKAENIRFAGQVSDSERQSLIAAATVLVLPSHLRSEAFGMVLVEAAMQSKALISCEIGTGTSFVNIDGETGFVIRAGDHLALARSIDTLLGDKALAERMGRAARDRYERFFSGAALGVAYAKLYREVLALNGTPLRHVRLRRFVSVKKPLQEQKGRVSASLVLYKSDANQYLEAIKSFLGSPSAYRLAVVENSRSSLALDLIKERFTAEIRAGKVVLLHLPNNPGYGSAHNRAFMLAGEEAKYHLILNPDVQFASSIVEDIARFMDTDETIALVMPKVYYPDGTLQRLCKRLPTAYDLLRRRFIPFLGNSEAERRYELHGWDMDRELNVPSLSGCFMFMRSSSFREVGCFDERFFMYAEDIDLTRRLHARWKTMYFPAVSIYHDNARESYESLRMLWVHTMSVIKYFNKWGWFIDPERRRINEALDVRIGESRCR